MRIVYVWVRQGIRKWIDEEWNGSVGKRQVSLYFWTHEVAIERSEDVPAKGSITGLRRFLSAAGLDASASGVVLGDA